MTINFWQKHKVPQTIEQHGSHHAFLANPNPEPN